MAKVGITETVLRDGHQSLIATRMRTEDMLPICKKLDAIGYWSLEMWGGATFDACVRFLKEDPWERLRALREALPNTRLQMLLRGQNLLGYRHYSDDVVEAFVKKSADNGIDVFRIFDALNDMRNIETAVKAVKKTGKHAQGAISYTTSPVHTVDAFVKMGKEMVNMGCDSIAIKDMAGLLTPAATSQLVTKLVKGCKVPIQIHSHATAGLSAMCQLKGIEAGASCIDTAISSFADGASHAATESMVAALRGTDYDTGLDLEALQEIGFYFREVRKKYHQFESEFTGLDTRVQVNQVPGGMISNLTNQLKEQGELKRINEVLDEIPKVRSDLGFPPLVTPTSQIVGTQAVINVVTGSRYKTITNEVKLYLQGKYGQAPGQVNELIRQQAVGNEPVITVRPADLIKPELKNLQQEIGAQAKSEEDVLTYAMFPDLGRSFLEDREKGTLKPEPLEPAPEENVEICGLAPTEFNITMHGETYHVNITGSGHRFQAQRPFYLVVDGAPEEVLVETIAEVSAFPMAGVPSDAVISRSDPKGSTRPKATKPGHVTTSMPGVIVDVLVKVGDMVSAGDTLFITEAMKMETEVQAPVGGKVIAVHITKGDSVNPDETLIEIE
ncbi:MAG: sodium-extruding oxaloacetate decarboxylase subunit alpha [Gammaproteobacteria bacterium]|nr:sodium-extruding oxaloacetate decarboxylase subunit alpha [Gammaproteobacteria bacterium]